MSKLIHVLAIMATMHGYFNCPAELPQIPNTPSFDRTIGIDTSDLALMCARKPAAVACSGHRGRALRLRDVEEIDGQYRVVFHYRTDEASWGRYLWDNWSACGECTEYALTLSELLAQAGEDGRDMALVLVMQCDAKQGCDAHARLWVHTSDHGMIEVDNQHSAQNPHWDEGEYEGYLVFDGKRHWATFPGWLSDSHGLYWHDYDQNH